MLPFNMSATVSNPLSTLHTMSYDALRNFVLRNLSQVKDINAVNLFHKWNRFCRQAQADKLGHWFLRECLAEQVLTKSLQYLSIRTHLITLFLPTGVLSCLMPLPTSADLKK